MSSIRVADAVDVADAEMAAARIRPPTIRRPRIPRCLPARPLRPRPRRSRLPQHSRRPLRAKRRLPRPLPRRPHPDRRLARAAETRRAPEQPTRVELRNLATGAVKSWQDIQSFTFSANATHLILRRKPPTAAGAGGGRGAAAAPDPNQAPGATGAAATPTGPRGADVILHNLTTGRDQLLGSVGDIAFNKTGDLLAYTVDASVKDANGLFVLDLRNGRINTLDDDARLYNRLTWSDDGTALAVLKGLDVDKMRERDNMLIAFPNVQAATQRRGGRAGGAGSGQGRPASRRAGSSAIAPRSSGATTTSACSSAPRRRCPRPTRPPASPPTSRPTSTSGTPPTNGSSRCR